MHRTRAFTLLELMVVLVIAATLVSVATSTWPSYWQRTRRAAAGAALVATLAQLEVRHARTGTYESQGPNPALRVEGYLITADLCSSTDTAQSGQCVEVMAVPTPPDPVCRFLLLRSNGQREPSNPACWP